MKSVTLCCDNTENIRSGTAWGLLHVLFFVLMLPSLMCTWDQGAPTQLWQSQRTAAICMWVDLTLPRTADGMSFRPHPALLNSAGPRELRPTKNLLLCPNWISCLGWCRADTAMIWSRGIKEDNREPLRPPLQTMGVRRGEISGFLCNTGEVLELNPDYYPCLFDWFPKQFHWELEAKCIILSWSRCLKVSEPPNQSSHTGDVFYNTAFECGRQPRSSAFSNKVKRRAMKEKGTFRKWLFSHFMQQNMRLNIFKECNSSSAFFHRKTKNRSQNQSGCSWRIESSLYSPTFHKDGFIFHKVYSYTVNIFLLVNVSPCVRNPWWSETRQNNTTYSSISPGMHYLHFLILSL